MVPFNSDNPSSNPNLNMHFYFVQLSEENENKKRPWRIIKSLLRVSHLVNFFLNWANPGLFLFIFGLFKQSIQLLQQMNVKNVMSIQYPAPGFEPMTFGM